MTFFEDIVKPFLFVGTIVFLFLYGLIGSVNRVAFSGEVARIEQLRSDAEGIDKNSEDILGQIVEVNKEIAQAQNYNKRWWADLAIADGWDEIKKIPVPK